MEEPTIVQKKAIDVTPYYHGIWCSVDGSDPFVNDIMHRRWSDNGKEIVFGLDSHNFYFSEPEDMMDVVEIEPAASDDVLARALERDKAKMANTPQLVTCSKCGGKGTVLERKRLSLFGS